VVTHSRAFYSLHAGLRVQRAPGFPCSPLGVALRPLILGGWFSHNSGVSRRGNAEVYLHVIASEAKQSILAFMLLHGLLRRFAPRNDGIGCLKFE
jgi:hypothetical protein